MNVLLIKGPANITGEELRQTLLEAFIGIYNADTDTWSDHHENVIIPQSGVASGTQSSGGAQICQLMSNWEQSEIESLLEDSNLTQYSVVGFQTFEVFPVIGTDPVEYEPIVTTAIENGTLQYLNKRYSDEAQTVEILPNVNWFPIYAGQSQWIAV